MLRSLCGDELRRGTVALFTRGKSHRDHVAVFIVLEHLQGTAGRPRAETDIVTKIAVGVAVRARASVLREQRGPLRALRLLLHVLLCLRLRGLLLLPQQPRLCPGHREEAGRNQLGVAARVGGQQPRLQVRVRLGYKPREVARRSRVCCPLL